MLKKWKTLLTTARVKKTIHAAIIPSKEVFGKKKKKKTASFWNIQQKKFVSKEVALQMFQKKNYPENVVAPLEK